MPFDLGHDATRLAPALRLIDEARIVAAHLVRRSPGREPERVAGTLDLEEPVHLGIGEGGIAPEVEALHDPPIAGSYGLQHRAPVCGTVHIARRKAQPSTWPNWLNTNSGW